MTDDLYTVAQVALLLGIDESRVRRLAEKRGLGRKLGPRMWTFTAADVAAMRERPQGKAGQAYYRRLDILNAITAALADLASRGSMSPVDYAQAKDAAQAAYLAQDEDTLIRLLRQYVPSDPRNE